MSTPSFATINNTIIRAALMEAGEQESGTIINDHYSPSFYSRRPAGFLGQHQDYSHLKNGLFGITQHEAYQIFRECTSDLSVQEVRRREIANEIVPLLPLPTTENTGSIDSFAGLPDSEWAEGKEGVYRPLSPTPSPPPAPGRTLPQEAARQQTQANGMRTIGLEIDQTWQQAGEDRDNESPLIQVIDGVTVSVPGASVPAAIAAAMSQSALADTSAPSQGARRAPPRIARETASTYPGRATTSRLKYKRGTKRPRTGPEGIAESVSTDTEAGDDSAVSGDEATLPPRKKAKLKLKNTRKAPAAREQAPRAKDSRASSELKEVAPGKATAPKAKPKASSVQTTSSKNTTIDPVISGAALPRTAAQARTADDARYALLLAQHRAPYRARKKKAPEHPELMPEYFDTANFPAGQQSDQVRCVCGVVVDDGGRMVCCDECEVWQHVECVGEAAPQDLDEGAYMCHNCAPYAHRKVIQRLRRANELEDLREGRKG